MARWAAIPHFSRIIIPPDLTKNGRPSPVPSRSASRLQSRENWVVVVCALTLRFGCHGATLRGPGRAAAGKDREAAERSGFGWCTASWHVPGGGGWAWRPSWAIPLSGGGDAFNVPKTTRLGWIQHGEMGCRNIE